MFSPTTNLSPFEIIPFEQRTGAVVHYRRKLLSFAVPAVAASVVVIPLFWFDSTALALKSGSSGPSRDTHLRTVQP